MRIQAIDSSVNLLKALLWQHEDATELKSLIEKKQEWYDINHTSFWNDWYRDVFDLDTANDFGLAVWARLLDVPLTVETDDTRDRPAFGFGPNHLNFENGNFSRFAGQQSLTLEQRRTVLQMRYFQLTSDGTVPSINEWLSHLFGDQGRAFVWDSHDMTYATYFFEFTPDHNLRYILENYDLMPRPAGVGVRWQVQYPDAFGFGIHHLNFGNAGFGA